MDLIGRVMKNNRGVIVRDVTRELIKPCVSDITNAYASGVGIRTKIGGYILTKLGIRIQAK